jgi:hypothetical protein
MFIHSLVIHIFTAWEVIGEKILLMCASDTEGGEHSTETRDGNHKEKKIHKQGYRFSTDFQIHALGYDFLFENIKQLAKVSILLVHGFFFL